MSKRFQIHLFWLFLMAVPFYLTHQQLIHQPFDFYWEDTYDGFRSHAATAYYLQHNPDYLHFEGMNYPYGDRIEYADVQTAFLLPVKVLVELGWLDAACGPGLLQLLVILSFWIGAVALFCLFRQWKVPPWYAAIVSVAILMLSPQLTRLGAHYALGHAGVLPVLLWLLYQYQRSPHWKWSIIIGLFLLWSAFIHQYFFAMGGALVGLYGVIQWLRHKENRWQRIGHLVMQTVIPLLLLLTFLKMGDSISDRTEKPWGFFAYHSSWPSVFLPLKYDEGEYVYHKWVGGGYLTSAEGSAFIGVASLVLLLAAIIRWFWIRATTRNRKPLSPPYTFLNPLMGAAVLILLISFGLPFSWGPMETYLDYMGPWKQFRSIGRFAWVFYYVVNVFVWYSLWHWVGESLSQKSGWRMPVYLLLFFLPLIGLVAEAIDYDHDHGDIPLYPAPANRAFMQPSDRPWLDQVDTTSYQAVLSLPFFHIGSDNLWYSPSEKTPHFSLWTSVQTGLPSMSSFMGRTSISQMLALASVVENTYYPPQALLDLPSGKKILLYAYRPSFESFKNEFAPLVEGRSPWYQDENCLLFDLDPFDYVKLQQKRRTEAIQQVDSMHLDEASYQYVSFDDQSAESLFGHALKLPIQSATRWYVDTLPPLLRDTALSVHFWLDIHHDMAPKTIWKIQIFDEDGAVIWQKRENLRYFINEIHQSWALIGVHIPQVKGGYSLAIALENPELFTSILVDELLIHPADQLTGFRRADQVHFEGRWVEDDR